MMHAEPVRCVGGIAHDDAGRLLLIKRAHEPARGQWSVPGGRVGPDESDAQAVVRELREETGLEVVPGMLLGTVTRGVYEIFDYACHAVSGALAPGDDADEARWVSAAEYHALDVRGELVAGLTGSLREWDALPRQ